MSETPIPVSGELPDPVDPADAMDHSVDRMTAAVIALANEAHGLRESVENSQRASRRAFITNLLGSATIVLLAVLIVILLAQARTRGNDNRATLNRLNDCVVAGGTCYAQLQVQNAKQIGVEVTAIVSCYEQYKNDASVAFVKCLESKFGPH